MSGRGIHEGGSAYIGVFPAALSISLAMASCAQERTPRDAFVEHVIPVLQTRCSAGPCHGVPPDAAEMGQVIDWSRLHFTVGPSGQIRDVEQAYQASLRFINTLDPPDHSSMLRKPLSLEYGGTHHFGKDNFLSPSEPGYRAIRNWIARETSGGEDPLPLSAQQAQFAADVQPVLVSTTCMNGNCHGTKSGVPFRLDGHGLMAEGANAMVASPPLSVTHHNYEQALSMLSLDGNPGQSRLIRKGLPLHAGGMRHKGGNASLFLGPDDPRVKAIEAWACAERKARLGLACHSTSADSGVRGFVFVAGPARAEGFFDLDVFEPGTDLYFAEGLAAHSGGSVSIVNLTAGLHDGPADIRDPAVHHDGRRVAFAMRRSQIEGHSIWELDLQTGTAVMRTQPGQEFEGGGMHTDRDPTWGPDGNLWFVSTRAGVVADGGAQLDGDLYELNPETGSILQRTFTPHIERKPVFFVVGEEAGGEIGFTALRAAIRSQARAHSFRFPPGLKTEYHQHFGITPPENVFFDTRELPDGNYVSVVGDLRSAWPAGRLAIIDRNFGPELNERADALTPSLPFYADPVSRLDADAQEKGETNAFYRDPVALPDGSLLVSVAPGPLSLADLGASAQFRIERLELREDPNGSGIQIRGRQVLISLEMESAWDPEPVFARAPARVPPDRHWNPSAGSAVLRHQGLGAIDGLLANLYPSGTKATTAEFHSVRLVEALRVPPSVWFGVPADQTRHHIEGATSLSLGGHGPQRVLCELPVAEDGSVQAAIMPRVPFRIQGLDAEGLAAGFMHNRWFDSQPGQKIPQGISSREHGAYSTQCAVCHGSSSGDPGETFLPPDAITTASLTLSRYVGGDPRLPIAPPRCDDTTIMQVDFITQIQPLLSRSCATQSCHAGPTPAAGVSLTDAPTKWYNDAYESLLAPGDGSTGGWAYVAAAEGSARQSFLIERLSGVELDAPRSLATKGVRHPADLGAPGLEPDELRLLSRWIDLGATFRAVATEVERP